MAESIEPSDTNPVEPTLPSAESPPAPAESPPAPAESPPAPAESPPAPAESPPADQIDLVDEKFEFSVPDGMDIDKEALKGFKEFSANEKLSRKTAQAVLDHLLESQAKAEKIRKANVDKIIEKNKEIIKSDPEIGGENYEKVQSAVDRLTLKYGGQDFKAQVIDAGLKSEPSFLRFIRNLNDVLSEDKVITPGQQLGSAAQKTYQEMADDFMKN